MCIVELNNELNAEVWC